MATSASARSRNLDILNLMDDFLLTSSCKLALQALSNLLLQHQKDAKYARGRRAGIMRMQSVVIPAPRAPICRSFNFSVVILR